VRIGEPQLYHIASDLGVDDARTGFKGQIFFGDSFDESKTGGTSSAIAAHLYFRAVGIEKTPPEIGTIRIFDNNQPICAHRYFSFAHRPYKIREVSHSQGLISVINQDEIIPASAHFEELYHYASLIFLFVPVQRIFSYFFPI
jgi:hypothetical protein